MAKIKFAGEKALKALISKVKALQWQIEAVDELPATGEEKVLYLVPVEGATGSNLYDEYIWKADKGAFERFGSATVEINLANYALKADFNTLKTYLNDLADRLKEVESGEVSNVEFDTTDAPEVTMTPEKDGTVVKVKVTTDLSDYVKSDDLEEITEDDVETIWEEAE